MQITADGIFEKNGIARSWEERGIDFSMEEETIL